MLCDIKGKKKNCSIFARDCVLCCVYSAHTVDKGKMKGQKMIYIFRTPAAIVCRRLNFNQIW